jgi:hypothetical protein
MLLVRTGGALRIAVALVVSPASFAAAVRDIKAELGAGTELLDLTVTRDGGNVEYRTAAAAGLAWEHGRAGCEPMDGSRVRPVG